FFQAEDGIRDFHVTGVQTCALPISDNDRSDQSIGFCPSASSSALILENGRLPKNPLFADSGEGCGAVMIAWRVVSISAVFFRARSEERRVGKEGGGRGAPGALEMQG